MSLISKSTLPIFKWFTLLITIPMLTLCGLDVLMHISGNVDMTFKNLIIVVVPIYISLYFLSFLIDKVFPDTVEL